jgi:hypothetical protein
VSDIDLTTMPMVDLLDEYATRAVIAAQSAGTPNWVRYNRHWWQSRAELDRRHTAAGRIVIQGSDLIVNDVLDGRE